MVLLQHCAGSVHKKKFCSRFYSNELEFCSQKRQIRSVSHSLGELGVKYALRTSSIARWKARGRLHIRYT